MAAVIAPICCFQRIVLYETKARFYLVGSNDAETRFRVLKIDRTEPKELVLSDDKVEYNRQEIKQLLNTINAGNIIKANKPYEINSKGLHRSISAYGILGFVRFLEGYYIILITERRKQAQIGGHTIYKIEDTRMISIPNEAIVPKMQHPDESRYVKIFQNVDLSSNFYYSYSYDLTHTLQHNMAPQLNPNFVSDRRKALWESWRCCTCKNNSNTSETLKQQPKDDNSTYTDSNEVYHDCKDSFCEDTDHECGDVNNSNSETNSFPNGEAQIRSNSELTSEPNCLVSSKNQNAESKTSDTLNNGSQNCKAHISNNGESTTESNCSVSNKNLNVESKTCETSNNGSQTDGNHEDKSEDDCNPLYGMEDTTTTNPFNICPNCKKFKMKSSHKPSKTFMSKACYKFVWNKHFLHGFEGKVHTDWVLHIVNGFIAQSNICVYGKPVYVTLIARRSAEFAGTRFLKRGANDEGYVANEVETEQIVHDASVLSFQNGRFTSYVQLRGSVPTYWSQDMKQVMVPKPQISVDRADPFCNAASKHVNNLLERFGAPLVILNLVKRRERKRHEQILSEELQSVVEYLNQFLPVEFHIKYIGWDMARSRKSKDLAVIEKLTAIADQVFKTTGFFHNCSDLYCNQVRKDPRWDNMGGLLCNGDVTSGRAQNGVLRVNCVDCLDRTNTAQFMVGKCALGFQLYSLGVIDSPSMEFDSDAVRILEDLYEAHGDTLALQYGGSQLVHGIRTYRKVSPLTSHTHDIMQTISRYYSNAFNDADKQQAINIFLGVFVPCAGKYNVWEMMTDYYLHHTSTSNLKALKKRPSYTSWLDEKVLNALPYPVWEGYCVGSYEPSQNDKDTMCLASPESVTSEEMDIFSEFYRPHVFTMFDTVYPLTMQRSCKDFMPAASNNHSPFIVRDLYKAPTRRRVPVRKDLAAAPGIPADDSSSDDGSSDDDNLTATSPKKDSSHVISFVSFQDLMPSMKEVYGVDLSEPNTHDKDIYESYSKISKDSEVNREKPAKQLHHVWKAHQPFSHDSVRQVKLPSVERHSLKLYTGYTETNHLGNLDVRLNSHSINLYREFTNHYQQPLIET